MARIDHRFVSNISLGLGLSLVFLSFWVPSQLPGPHRTDEDWRFAAVAIVVLFLPELFVWLRTLTQVRSADSAR